MRIGGLSGLPELLCLVLRLYPYSHRSASARCMSAASLWPVAICICYIPCMTHDVLLIGDQIDPGLRKALSAAGCVVRAASDVRRARQALLKKAADLVFANLEDETASFRLSEWVAKHGVHAMVIALADASAHMDVPCTRPPVLRFVHRTAPPGVVRRVVLSSLCDLKACRRLRVAKEAADTWPLAVVSPAGHIHFTTPEALKALAAISAPRVQQPVRRLDADLIRRIRSAVGPRRPAGQVALFRRDVVLSHYEAYVRRMEGGNLSLLLLDARHWGPAFHASAKPTPVRQARRGHRPR
jgi:hypothetical protein